jgi:hypothetical protein
LTDVVVETRITLFGVGVGVAVFAEHPAKLRTCSAAETAKQNASKFFLLSNTEAAGFPRTPSCNHQ